MADRISRLSLWVFGAAIVLQFIMPFVYPIVGHDAAVHLNWLEQFPRLFREGNLYPRWMPDSFWGFGSPAFYFYPPLAYWWASLISFVFPSPVAMYQILGLLATLASVASCYLYLRSITNNKRSAQIGALVYGVFSYRLLDLYLRNAIGEHIAFIFLPLILLGLEKGLRSNNRRELLRSIIFSTIGWAGLLLSNIPTAVIAIYSVPIYSWIRSRQRKQYGKFFFPLIGATIGAMIAAVYLLPISEYISAIKLSHLWDLQEAEGNTGYALLDIVHGNYRYFYIGLIVTLNSGIWLAYRFYLDKKTSDNKNLLSVFFVFLLLVTIVQIPYLLRQIVAILPFFKLIQFSYRWDILIVLASAVYVALHFETSKEKSTSWFVGLSSIVTILIALGYFNSMDGLHWKYHSEVEHIDAPEYLPASASLYPKSANKEIQQHEMDGLIMTSDDSIHIHIFSATSESIKFSVDKSDNSIPVAFHRMFFPAWKLRRSDGMEVQLAAFDFGRMIAVLPATGGEFKLSIQKSQIEKNGEIFSFAGLSILGILILLTIFSQKPESS